MEEQKEQEENEEEEEEERPPAHPRTNVQTQILCSHPESLLINPPDGEKPRPHVGEHRKAPPPEATALTTKPINGR